MVEVLEILIWIVNGETLEMSVKGRFEFEQV